jgi:hypothetical protein
MDNYKWANLPENPTKEEIKSEIAFGRSWVFQFGNGNKFDCDTGIFGKPDTSHYVSFVSLNVPKRTGELRALVKVQWLHDKKLFKAMKKQSLQGNKVAVYYEDLEKFGSEKAVKEAGRVRLEGKEYLMKDGDICHFRFNV